MPDEKNSAPGKNGVITRVMHSAEERTEDVLKNVKEGTYNFEKKVVGLPINRQVLFWVGIALILSAFFKSYGNFAAFLIGIGVTFAAFTGKNIVVDVIGQKERTPASSTTSPENTPQKK